MKREIRFNLSSEEVRGFCIEYGLYTYGTNEQYANMLEICSKPHLTENGIFIIARNIVNHSDETGVIAEFGDSDEERIDYVAEALFNRAGVSVVWICE